MTPTAPTRHHTQYFEMFGHRSIYHDGWRAVCPWPGPNFTEAAKKGRAFSSPISAEVLAEIEANDWELYDLTKDYSETHNVAADHRAKVIEMVGRWWTEAGKYGVMPLDGDVRARLALERPAITASGHSTSITRADRPCRSPPRRSCTTGHSASLPTRHGRRIRGRPHRAGR